MAPPWRRAAYISYVFALSMCLTFVHTLSTLCKLYIQPGPTTILPRPYLPVLTYAYVSNALTMQTLYTSAPM